MLQRFCVMRQFKKAITIFFFFSCGILYGQESENYTRIYTNILQYVDVSHPRANLGIERDLKRNRSIALGVGVYYENWMYNEPTTGMSFGMEYKLFTKKKFYYALGVSTGKLAYETSDEFQYGDTDSAYVESFKINKTLADLYFKFGYRKDLGRRFYVDCFAGLGIQYKETIHNRTRPEDTQTEASDITLVDIRDSEGKFYTPVLKLGIIIGLKLN